MFDDAKEQLKTNLTTAWETIQEQDWFLTLREKFEVLPTATQKIIKFSGIGVVLFILALIPIGNYLSASDFIETFEEERNLTREFLKAKSEGDLPNLPPPVSTSSLRERVDGVLSKYNLAAEQVERINPTDQKPKYAPRSSKVAGLNVELKTLNVKQIKDIGYDLQNIKDVKITGVSIDTSPKDDHYYDVIYTVKNIALPPLPKEEDNTKGRKGKKRGRGGRGRKNSKKDNS